MSKNLNLYALKNHKTGLFGVPIVGKSEKEFTADLSLSLQQDTTAPITYFKENSLFKLGEYDPNTGIVNAQNTEILLLWDILEKNFQKVLIERDKLIAKMLKDKQKLETKIIKENNEIHKQTSE